MSPIGTPIDIARHYDFPLDELNGEGQSIGIIDLDNGFNRQTLLENLKTLGVSVDENQIREKNAGGGVNIRGGFRETQEDVEILASICPGATLTVYNGSMSAILDAMVDDGITVASCSWGFGPDTLFRDKHNPYFSQVETSLKAAKESGLITICVAVGDGGSSDTRGGRHSYPTKGPGNLAYTDYPASSPYVLAVGGTEHIADSEVVWNNTPQGGATGGGVSDLFPRPDWQADVASHIVSANPAKCTTGKPGRVIPDVAAFAGFKDYELVFNASGSRSYNGGTSAATPLWAALIALANQARQAKGKKPLGWINERLYSVARQSSVFTAISMGNNKSTPDSPGYYATGSYNACCGFGVPRGKTLIEALCNLP